MGVRPQVLTGSQPDELIIQGAMSGSCNLVFMASQRGISAAARQPGRETGTVVCRCKLPVLVYAKQFFDGKGNRL